MDETPDIEYVCEAKHENVPETLEDRVARCGSDRCEGIAYFRSTFIPRAVNMTRALRFAGRPDQTSVALDVVLLMTIDQCKENGYCVTFQKFSPVNLVTFVFGCQFCEREETVHLNQKLECLEDKKC